MDGLTVWFVVWSVDGLCTVLNHYALPHSRTLGFHLPYFLAFLGLFSPFLLQPHDAVFRAVLSLASVFYFCKVREVLVEPRFAQEPLLVKFCSVGVSFFDMSDRSKAVDSNRMPRFAIKMFWMGVHITAQLACLELVNYRHLLPVNSAVRTQITCMVLCLYFFFSLHAFSYALQANLILLMPQYDFQALMDSPEHASTVRGFWKRWDLVIQKLLFKYVYKTCKQISKNTELSIALTFLASGLVHVWPILAASLNNWPEALEMFAYFVYQLGIIAVEAKLLGMPKVANLVQHHAWIGKLWSITHLFGPSYLLIHPAMALARVDF
ncbi:hypothetical protein BASA81_003192 [Batrachochytrium salamandrivorans]|nr:hypothetical protein BASA81_003192 [Batrachochytrium salamandrivorans]